MDNEELELYPIIKIGLNLGDCDDPFDLHCPVCGHKTQIYAWEDFCSHMLFVFGATNEEIWISDEIKKLVNDDNDIKKDDDNDIEDDDNDINDIIDILVDILNNGYKVPLMVYEIESTYIPQDQTFHYAYSLADWVDWGIRVYT